MSDFAMVQSSPILRVRLGAGGKVYWDAQWRYRTASSNAWKLKKRRLGQAWLEPDGDGGWQKRSGRRPADHLDERLAYLAADEAMTKFAAQLAAADVAERLASCNRLTVRELSHEWLKWLAQVRGAKPSTVEDYGFLLREPGVPNRRGKGVSTGRIMSAFGDRPFDEVTAADVSRFLRSLDAEPLTPRNVNKHRQVLAAIFSYACRADAYGLATNPVAGTDKRREDPPAALDYYEVHEVERLAVCCAQGLHRGGYAATSPEEVAARDRENRQDADLFRTLFYTGLRLGEVLVLRIEDVDLQDRLILVRRGLSAGVESTPKGRRHRFVPLSAPAKEALIRVLDRDEFLADDDYVFVNRLGRRLEGSALRRRYKRACEQAKLRPVKLHGLRHAAGSLIARTNDPVFVRDFLGHAKLSTTDRYVSAKFRPEEFARLDQAFEPTSPGAMDTAVEREPEVTSR